MTEPAPIHKGKTQLVEPTPQSWAWMDGKPGRQWHAKRPLVEHPLLTERAARDAAAYLPVDEGDPLDAAKGIAVGLAICVPLWVAFVFWTLG